MEGFIDFFRSATPIDALELSRIGSRPSRRTGQRSLADLRAIPGVFSWTQSRYYLPGWFGIGTALHRLQGSNPQGFGQVVELRQSYPFLRFVLTNAETNLASAERLLMEKYATLCPPEERVTAVFRRILEEFDLAQSKRSFGRRCRHKAAALYKDASDPCGCPIGASYATGHSAEGLAGGSRVRG
jgi:phosphoenolpyruvate carboxylase